MTVCTAPSDKPTEIITSVTVPLSFTQLFFFQLIVLVLWHTNFTVLIESRCSHQPHDM